MLHRIHEERVLPVDADPLWAVLSDYQRLVSWMPHVVGSAEMVREGGIVVIECQIPSFPDQSLVLELVETPPHGITFNQVDFYDQQGLTGKINLSPQRGGTKVELSFSISASLFDWKFKKRVNALLEDIFQALQERAEAFASGAVAPTGRRKILEVRQKANTVEVWFRGEVYTYVGRAQTGDHL